MIRFSGRVVADSDEPFSFSVSVVCRLSIIVSFHLKGTGAPPKRQGSSVVDTSTSTDACGSRFGQMNFSMFVKVGAPYARWWQSGWMEKPVRPKWSTERALKSY